MPEEKKKIQLGGKEIDVSAVPIKTATESFAEYELEDGSKLKVKSVVTSFLRIEGTNNPLDGTPVYLAVVMPVVSVVSASENLIKKPQQGN